MTFKLILKDKVVAVDCATLTFTELGGPSPHGHWVKAHQQDSSHFSNQKSKLFPF